jgi:hypothetical protein
MAPRAWTNVALMTGLFILFWFVAGGIALRYFILFIGVMSNMYALWDIVDDTIARKANGSDASAFADICGCFPSRGSAIPQSVKKTLLTLPHSLGCHLAGSGCHHVRCWHSCRYSRLQGQLRAYVMSRHRTNRATAIGNATTNRRAKLPSCSRFERCFSHRTHMVASNDGHNAEHLDSVIASLHSCRIESARDYQPFNGLNQ